MPYRADEDGQLRILLITSRETQRWVIPKGNPIKGLKPHEAAAREAFEEAGLEGVPSTISIGAYRYDKRRQSGASQTMTVDVFPFAVTGQAKEWPEKSQRTCAWFAFADAADAVDEPELKTLIGDFHPPTPASAGHDASRGSEQRGLFAFLRRWFGSPRR